MSSGGRLLVCATPIGNLGDVTLRVIDALKACDAILAEDTRVTSKLLARYGIEKPLVRYDEHVAARATASFVHRIAQGETFALVSDAGTPGVSDPGSTLVAASLDAGLPVEVLPGASAVLSALVASGLPTHAFYFGGFLPRKAGERTRALAPLATLDATLIFYESPKRTAATLAALAETLGDRAAAVARELTKLHEEVARGTLPALAEQFAARENLKGEVVLLVGPPSADEQADIPGDDEIAAAVNVAVATGATRAQAVKQVAVALGLPRNAVYEIAHRK